MLRILFLIGFLLVKIHAYDDYINYPEVQQSYKFYRTPEKWFDAWKICRQEDATLAQPKNFQEANVLKTIFAGYPTAILPKVKNTKLMWTSFHDMFQEGEFVGENGVPLQYFYRNWENREPNNAKGNENCVGLTRSGLLNDYNCNNPIFFICQKNKVAPITNNSENTRCSSKDPAYEFSSQTKKCYKFHSQARKWFEAHRICMAEGGYLAIINSQKERDFIVSQINRPGNGKEDDKEKKCVFVGFHDIFEEGYFITVEGDEIQRTGFSVWAEGEPNNRSGKENCGSLNYSGRLNDAKCDLPHFFVCEKNSKA